MTEDSSVRRCVYGSYLIFYTVTARDIRVLPILHAARDVGRIMLPITRDLEGRP